ncbi:BadF/BadG/BcrA/BcrD ATPase family protein [Streptomyces aureus]|uniref:BadF/BadG/BcrA/BcrD ATPase family protein n=1 Tax=Streptomyces aureus TaxID=193461 RepID=A0ABV4SW33_9ACTN
MGELYLGVDAGNSKTAALVCTAAGEIVGYGRSGCGDIYGAPTSSDAVAEVAAAVGDALAGASVAMAGIAGAAFRLAGVDWPEDCAFWDTALREKYPTLRRRSILNDGYAAIRCGEPSGVGVAVIAGTAAAVAARGPGGAVWDLGWWPQHSMGAAGLAEEALKAVYLADLGLGSKTSLTEGLLEFFGRSSVFELNRWFTRREGAAPWQEKPRAARVVTAAAEAGDQVAQVIVREQGRRLAMYAGVAARKVGLADGPGKVSVVLSGSVLMAVESPVADALLAELDGHVPGVVPHRAVVPPVAGAALDALGESGIPVTPAVTDRIAATLPPKEFLAT